MKALLTLLTLPLFSLSLTAIIVPESSTPVLTPQNMISSFVRVDPDDMKPETLPTKAWIWQDGNYLVVYYEAEIDASFKAGTARMRDEGGDADYLRVQLITQPESYYAYYFLGFPSGGLYDGTRDLNMNVDYSWNSNYSYESKHSGKLWQLTMRIPLSELRFPPHPPYMFKIILARYNDSKEEIFSSPYVNTNMGKDYFLKGIDLQLSHRVKRKLEIKLKPYLVKSYDMISKTSSFDPDYLGLDVSLNPGQRSRVKLSFNPDYSDVPPDDASDNYNSKYPPYYYENRFFFSEDIDAFGVEDLLYTRNIVKPSFAWKATGTANTLNWGVLGALDREIKDDTGALINPDDYFQVLALGSTWSRVKINTALLGRLNKDYYNGIALADAEWEFVEDVYIRNKFQGSAKDDDRDVPSDRLDGFTNSSVLGYKPTDWDLAAYYSYVSRDFNADTGFPMETDFWKAGYSIDWTPPARDRYLKNMSFSAWGEYYQFDNEADEHPVEYSNGANFWASFSPKYNLSLTGSHNQVLDLARDPHSTWSGTLSLGFPKWSEFGMYIQATYANTLVYKLYHPYDLFAVSLNMWGTIARKLGYTIYLSNRQYGYDKINTVVVNGTPQTVVLDDNYSILNAYLSYDPNAKARALIGTSIDSYERGADKAWLQFYGNIRYEIMPESFLYMGFSTQQTKTADFEYDTAFQDFRKDSATAYVKLALTL